MVGRLSDVSCCAASGWIAIALYPVLKKHNEGCRLCAVGSGWVESVFYIVGALFLLSVITVGQHMSMQATQDGPTFQAIGHYFSR